MEGESVRQNRIQWWEPPAVIVFVAAWAGATAVGLLVLLDGSPLGDQMTFVLTAAVGGVLGALPRVAEHFMSYFRSWQLWLEATTRDEKGSSTEGMGTPPQRWNRTNNLLIKPLLYPIGGIVAGSILALVFLDTGVSSLRILLLGLVGGVLWPTVLEKLPKMFGFERGPQE